MKPKQVANTGRGRIHERKSWEVINNDKYGNGTLEIDGKKYRYGRSGGFKTSDQGLARAINQKYGMKEGTDKAVVVEVDNHTRGRSFLVRLPKNYKG